MSALSSITIADLAARDFLPIALLKWLWLDGQDSLTHRIQCIYRLIHHDVSPEIYVISKNEYTSL